MDFIREVGEQIKSQIDVPRIVYWWDKDAGFLTRTLRKLGPSYWNYVDEIIPEKDLPNLPISSLTRYLEELKQTEIVILKALEEKNKDEK